MSTDQQTRPTTTERTTSGRRPAWVAVAVFVAVLVVGIGLALVAGLGSEPDVADSSTTTVVESLGPDARPETPVQALLGEDPDQIYFARSSGDFDAATLGIAPGAVTAQWYRAEGFYVVFFAGLEPDARSGLCPSAAIFGSGDDFMANAAVPGADCSAIVINELPDRTVRTLVCGDGLALRTAIPEDRSGTLVAALEMPVADEFGGIGVMGLSSAVDVVPADVPAIDLALFDC